MMTMFAAATVLLLLATVSADPFIYNVYSSSGSQSPYGNPYSRGDEVYIRRPGMGASPYYSGMGNQMMMLGGGAGGMQGLSGLQGLQGIQSIQSMQGLGMQPYGASSMMGVGSYGQNVYNKPRFAASEMMMGGMGMGQPLVLNGYPMYPKTSGYPMVIPLGMGSYGSSPTVYQGPTVSRLPFQAAAKRARFFY